MRKAALSRLSAAVLLVTAGIFAGRATADQPHMQTALSHLQQARQELELADPDKGGHRGKALALVARAIAQVERGIAFERGH